MTQGNIHYLIGWAGAILIVLIIVAGMVLHSKYTYEQEKDAEGNEEITGHETER